MQETSARLLRLLTLLQTRREWSGTELADRLGVSTRTLRRDVDKLRDLDYPVHSGMGPGGGYRLGAGAKLPPLLLDDEEATAVAVGLRTTAGASVAGIGEASLRALVKLEQVLPPRLRHRIQALQVSTVAVPGMPTVDAEVLTMVATACRDHQRLRFDYRGEVRSVRVTEPHQLVVWGRRWYLVAWDVGRDDWRTFRVDRMGPLVPTGPRFVARDLPGGDAAAFVADGVARLWPYQATVRLHAPAASPTARACATYGRVEPIDERTCRLHLGADSPHALAFLLGALGVDFDVQDSPGLAEQLLDMADRYRRAVEPIESRGQAAER